MNHTAVKRSPSNCEAGHPLYSLGGEYLGQIAPGELRLLAGFRAVKIGHFRKGRRIKRVTLVSGELSACAATVRAFFGAMAAGDIERAQLLARGLVIEKGAAR